MQQGDFRLAALILGWKLEFEAFSIFRECFPARGRAIASCHSRLQTGTNRPTCAQRQQCGLSRASLRTSYFYVFFGETEVSEASLHSCLTSSFQSGPRLSISQIKLSLQSRALFVDNFPRPRPETAEKQMLPRPQEPPYL